MNIAFLPLRAGSKGIPDKNIRMLAGKPLCFWIIEALLGAETEFDKIIISTDSDKYRDLIFANYGHIDNIFSISRSEEVSCDTATTEAVVLEYIDSEYGVVPFDVFNEDKFLLVQATSPYTESNDIDQIMSFDIGHPKSPYNSVFSAVDISSRVIWTDHSTGFDEYMFPLSKNPPVRQPRQSSFFTSKKPVFMENGALYLNTIENWIKFRNRFRAPIGVYEMELSSIIEIDSHEDWDAMSYLLRGKYDKSFYI